MISLLVAVAENGVIGRGGELPWHLPDDLKRFKALTWGKPMLMGRKTFESIGRALPGRISLVLTRSRRWAAPEGVIVVHSMEEAMERARGAGRVDSGAGRVDPAGAVDSRGLGSMGSLGVGAVDTPGEARELAVIGGADVFRLALPLAGRIELTRVHAEVSGDTFFPPLDAREWRETERIEHPADARHAYAMTFSVLVRQSLRAAGSSPA